MLCKYGCQRMIIYLIVCTNLRNEVIIMRCKKAIREKKGILSNSKIMVLMNGVQTITLS
jgi:hypothetical protein